MTSSVLTLVNPYVGLAPFDEGDSSRFFGRDKEVEEIVDRLGTSRLLAVTGVSGCGKSSLVRAGVIPILRMGVVTNLPTRWRICTISPGNDPLGSLATALAAPRGWPATSFDLVEHVKRELRPAESLLVIVDQFEELFRFRAETIDRDGGNASALFVNLLLNAVDQREVPVYVLLTMRTDYLGECAQFRGLPEALNNCYYLVPRTTRLQQQEAIERPLEQVGAAASPALVQRLLNEAAEDPDNLPVLEHLLKRLWENWSLRGVNGPITLKDYEDVGGWQNALANDAESVLKEFPSEEAAVRILFQWITERGTGKRPIRRPRSFSECLEVSGLSGKRLTEVIRAFQGRGLIRPSELTDQSLIDLPHESLMWQWPRLSRWILEEAEHATQLGFLLQSARQNVLLTGLALESGLQWRSRWRHEKLSALRYLQRGEFDQTEDWIGRSDQAERAKTRRRRMTLGGIGALVIIIIAIVVLVANQQRRATEARELASWAAVNIEEDPQLSLALGLYSYAREPEMVGGLEQTLHTAILRSHGRLTLQGHQSGVLSVAWCPAGNKLATASEDHTAKVWEASTGRELLTMHGHQGSVTSIAWSLDGKRLATASSDKTAKVWEASTGREVLTLQGHQASVTVVAWSPDGRMLATASSDRTARVWDSSTGHQVLTLQGHQATVYSIAWSPDGRMLATASSDNTARVWEASTGQEVLNWPLLATARSIAWSPDGRMLATTSGDRTVRVWETSKGRELRILQGHQDSVLGVAWSPDGSKLATASADDTARVWDASTGRELLTLQGHQDSVLSVAWSPDGSKLATASADRTARVWEAFMSRELLTLQNSVYSIAWSPDGSKLATASYDSTATVWEANTGRELLALQGHELLTPKGHLTLVYSIAWSPDGSKLATASSDNTAKVWEASTGRELLTLKGHQATVNSIAWSPDSSKVATASGDRTAKVWEASTGRELITLHGHHDSVESVAWSSSGRKLATASSDNTERVWEASTGRELIILRGHQDRVESVAWSPDGKRLASSGRDQIAQVYAIDQLLLLRLVRPRIIPLTSEDCGRYLKTTRCPPLPDIP